ncbi:hypothetical protein HYH03_009572 [Edaphochlamys debaryana]|uniref:Subtilisin n=1 Tax=Edaphochlamys debaryana TaxID=47281 RepID=A0A835XXM5_9CHLO|nr:hypothetical protein HYH03_009572 [Edaphochlamys debaryana]|eukprot:KAG2492076.1 hypothetical protein HYH03_009572 [Edaphochlamys debaryana]
MEPCVVLRSGRVCFSSTSPTVSKAVATQPAAGPLDAAAAEPRPPVVDPSGRELFLVNFGTGDPWPLRASLVAAGAEVLEYIPDRTLLVLGAPGAVRRAAARHGGLVAEYAAGSKVAPETSAILQAAAPASNARRRARRRATAETAEAGAGGITGGAAAGGEDEEAGAEAGGSCRAPTWALASRGLATWHQEGWARARALTWQRRRLVEGEGSDATSRRRSLTEAAAAVGPSSPQYGVSVGLVPRLAGAAVAAEGEWLEALGAALERGGPQDPCWPRLLGDEEAGAMHVYLCEEDLPDGVAWLSRSEAVTWVSRVPRIRPRNAVAGWISQTGTLSLSRYSSPLNDTKPYWKAGLQGQGVILGVADTGIDASHCAFIDDAYLPADMFSSFEQLGTGEWRVVLPLHRKIVQYITAQGGDLGYWGDITEGHGTHTSCSLAGAVSDGAGGFVRELHTGAAPLARLSFYDLSPVEGGESAGLFVPPAVERDLLPFYTQVGASISSESWGAVDAASVVYDAQARQFDVFAWRNPGWLTFIAAGNDGDNSLVATTESPATAKNIISVGASTNRPKDAPMAAGEDQFNVWFRYTDAAGKNQSVTVWPHPLKVLEVGSVARTARRVVVVTAPCTAYSGAIYSGAVLLVDEISEEGCSTMEKAKFAALAGAVVILWYAEDSSWPYFWGDLPEVTSTSLGGLTPPKAGRITRAQAEWMGEVIANASNTNIHIQRGSNAGHSGIDAVTSFSCNGPMPDGRFKPDIVAPGEMVLSASSGAEIDDTVDSETCSNEAVAMRGTSMASPVAAGHAGLFRQYFTDGYYPTGAPNSTRSAPFTPSGMLLKAAVIAGAESLEGGFARGPGILMGPSPDGYQGWGRLDLSGALPLPGLTPANFSLQVVDWGNISTGDRIVIKGLRATGTGPIIAVLVWHDYPGALMADSALVNDLDLGYLVNQPDSAPYQQTRRDSVNNVERAELRGLRAGDNVSLVVFGAAVNHALLTATGTGRSDTALPQRWALAVAGHFTGTLRSPLNPAYVRPQGLTDSLSMLEVAPGVCLGAAGDGPLAATAAGCSAASFQVSQQAGAPGGGSWTVFRLDGRCLSVAGAQAGAAASLAPCDAAAASQRFGVFRHPHLGGSCYLLVPSGAMGSTASDRLCLRYTGGSGAGGSQPAARSQFAITRSPQASAAAATVAAAAGADATAPLPAAASRPLRDGLDVCVSFGTCVSFCDLTSTKEALQQLSDGVRLCNASAPSPGQCGSGEACLGSTTCRSWVCNASTQALEPRPCSAQCVPQTPAATAADLSADGRQITLTLGAPAALLPPGPCGRVFGAGTSSRLGGAASLCRSTIPRELVVVLPPTATILPGENLTFAANTSLVSQIGGVGFRGSVKLRGCAACTQPEAYVTGPTLLAPPCPGAAVPSPGAAGAVFDATISVDPAGRPLADAQWSVDIGSGSEEGRAVLQAAVDRTNQLNTTGSRLRLVLTAEEVAALTAGDFGVSVEVTSWLGTKQQSDIFGFTKQTKSGSAPDVTILGPRPFSVSLRGPLRLTAVPGANVCPGRPLRWSWSLLPLPNWASWPQPGSAPLQRPSLYLPGPLAGLPGDERRIAVRVSYADVALPGADDTTITSVIVLLMGSPPVARLDGPSGDVASSRALVLDARGSTDPDAPPQGAETGFEQPLSFVWNCEREDAPMPCFANSSRGDMASTLGVWSIPAGLLAPERWHTFTVTVAKPGAPALASTAMLSVRPRAVAAGTALPQGRLRRLCAPAACGVPHDLSSDLSLMLELAPDSTSSVTQVTWSSPQAPVVASLAATPGPTPGTFVVTVPASALSRWQTAITVTATLTSAGGVSAAVTTTVDLNAPPEGPLPGGRGCLELDLLGDTAPATALARAVGWTDAAPDGDTIFEFGLATASGQLQLRQQGPSASATLAGLPAGNHTAYLCARDPYGARACELRGLVVKPAPAGFNATAALAALTPAGLGGNAEALLQAASQAVTLIGLAFGGSPAAPSGPVAASVAQAAVGLMAGLMQGVNLADIQESERVLAAVGALAAAANATLDDAARLTLLGIAENATAALAPLVGSSADTAPGADFVTRLCAILGLSLPTGSGATGRRRELLVVAAADARTWVSGVLGVAQTLSGLLAVSVAPGGGFTASGDAGVYVSSASLLAPASGGTTTTLQAGPSAASSAAASAAAAGRRRQLLASAAPTTDAEAQLVLSASAAAGAAGWAIGVSYTSSATAALQVALAGSLPSGGTILGGLTSVSWTQLAGASGSAPALDGTNSYLDLALPAPGYAATRGPLACLLYDAATAALTGTLPGLPSGGSASPVFVSYDSGTGKISCRTSQLGNFVVVQAAPYPPPTPPPPPAATTAGNLEQFPEITTSSSPPSPTSTLVMTLTLAMNTSQLASQSDLEAFQAALKAALVVTLQVSPDSVTITSVSLTSTGAVVAVVEVVLPPSRSSGSDSTATAFLVDPLAALPADFKSHYAVSAATAQQSTAAPGASPSPEPQAGLTTPTTTTPNSSGVSQQEEEDAKDFPVGLVAGVAAGGGVGLLLLAVLAAYLVMRNRAAQEAKVVPSAADPAPPASAEPGGGAAAGAAPAVGPVQAAGAVAEAEAEAGPGPGPGPGPAPAAQARRGSQGGSPGTSRARMGELGLPMRRGSAYSVRSEADITDGRRQ